LILELVSFRLRAGVSEEQFNEAVRAVDTFLAKRPGFLSRQVLTVDADDSRVDLVWWSDLADAQGAADAIRSDPHAASFMACLDPASVDLSHARLMHSRPDQLPW
jgi:heme-degrading monooxygenase HmoA